jgi:superfamily II DNA or RNA helicase
MTLTHALNHYSLDGFNSLVKLRTGSELNDIQKGAFKELFRRLEEQYEIRGIIGMPTGTGKTRLASAFLLYLRLQEILKKGDVVLWQTPRDIILVQTEIDELRKFLSDCFEIRPLLEKRKPMTSGLS